MIRLVDHGMFLVDGALAERAALPPQQARQNTIAAQIREELNLSSILMTEEPSAYQFLE